MRRALYTIAIAVALCACGKTDEPVVVSFEVNAIAPLMYEFTNNSTGCTEYKWDFGDGSWSTGINSLHGYDKSGTYTVTLIGTAEDGAHYCSKQLTVSDPRVYIAGYTLYAIPYDNRYYKVVFKDDALLPSSWDFQTGYTPLLTNANLPYTVQLKTPVEMTNYKNHDYYTIQVIRNESTYNTAGEISCVKGKLTVSQLMSSYSPEYVIRTESGSTAIGIHMQYDY